MNEKNELVESFDISAKKVDRHYVERMERWREHFLWHAKQIEDSYLASYPKREALARQALDETVLPFFRRLIATGLYDELVNGRERIGKKFYGKSSIAELIEFQKPGYAISELAVARSGGQAFQRYLDQLHTFSIVSGKSVVDPVRQMFKESLLTSMTHLSDHENPPGLEIRFWGVGRDGHNKTLPYRGVRPLDVSFDSLEDGTFPLSRISPVYFSKLAKQIENGTVQARLGAFYKVISD